MAQIVKGLTSEKFLHVGGKRVNFSCSYCSRDITLQCRIHCAVCADVQLCVDCFCAGVKFTTHDNIHPYRVVDNTDIPIFVKDWTISEELLLLEGIDKFGLGNWKMISEYIVSKSAKQCEEHYWECYMGVHGYCLPVTTIQQDVQVSTLDKLNNDASIKIAWEDRPLSSHPRLFKPTTTSNTELATIAPIAGDHLIGKPVVLWKASTAVSTTAGSKGGGGGRDRDSKNEIRDRSVASAALSGSELPGFLRLREDFDVEYENDAENLLADMEFAVDDHPSERELKLQVVKIYNSKLDERNRRKRFVIDRGLVDVKKLQQAEKRRSKEDRELIARIRMFARFQTQEEHDALVDGLLKARKLKQQIEVLSCYRQLGITTLEQVKQFEIDKRKRETELKAKKNRDSASYLYETGRSSSSSSSFYHDNSNSLDLVMASATIATAPSAQPAIGSASSLLPPSGKRGSSNNLAASNSNSSNIRRGNWEEDNSNVMDDDSTTSGSLMRRVDSNNSIATSASSLLFDNNTNNNSNSFNIKLEEGIAANNNSSQELLSVKELELCKRLSMPPITFLTLKEALVREAYRNGTLTAAGVRRIIRTESTNNDNNSNTTELYDFFVADLSVGFDLNNSNSNNSNNDDNNGYDGMTGMKQSNSSSNNTGTNNNKGKRRKRNE